MITKIRELLEEVQTLKAKSEEEIEALRIKYLSKKGIINSLMAEFREVPAEQKKAIGIKINELKQKAQEQIAQLKEEMGTNDFSSADLDLTRTAYPIKLGTRHPISIVTNEVIDIFTRLGFNIAEGPEMEEIGRASCRERE